MNKRDRRKRSILEHVEESGAVSVRELANRLNVTGVTIRRDLNQLSQENRLRLMHGVAISNDHGREDDEEYQVTEAERHQAAEKRAIGVAAAGLLEPDDIVIIDAGTTTEWIAQALSPDMSITVICNSLNIVNRLSRNDNCRLIVPGGVFRKSSMMFESDTGINLIRDIRAQKAFISASGVDIRLGVTCTNMYEIGPKQAAIESSGTRILVVDSSKFGSVRVAYFAPITDFDIVITDDRISDKHAKMVEDAGIRLIVTSAGNSKG